MFTPERLVLARKRRKMTLAALARQAGISPQSLTAFENHRKTPSGDTLSNLAAALNYPEKFFTSPPPVEMQPAAVSFRAPSRMSALERDSALSSGAVAAALNAWLEDHFRLPHVDIPALPQLSPEHAAEHVRAAWGLGEDPIPNVVHLLEAHGVRVFSLAPDCLDADAFSTLKNHTPYVFLNTRKTAERGRFDAAHELGHLTLHCEHRTAHGREGENEANAFASAFLMPKAGILAQQLHNAPVDRILTAKHTWGVSAMALAYRLRTLGLLTEWRYAQTTKDLARRGYRTDEPGSPLPREASQLLAKVFAALRARGITPQKLCEDLAIYPDELNDYVFGLVPTSLEGGHQTSPPAAPRLHLVHSS